MSTTTELDITFLNRMLKEGYHVFEESAYGTDIQQFFLLFPNGQKSVIFMHLADLIDALKESRKA